MIYFGAGDVKKYSVLCPKGETFVDYIDKYILICDWKPAEIKQIVTMYCAAILFSRKNEIIVAATADITDYSVIKTIIDTAGGVEYLQFGRSGNFRVLEWSKENHCHFPNKFQRGVVAFFFAMKNFPVKVPRVLIIEIIKLLALNN